MVPALLLISLAGELEIEIGTATGHHRILALTVDLDGRRRHAGRFERCARPILIPVRLVIGEADPDTALRSRGGDLDRSQRLQGAGLRVSGERTVADDPALWEKDEGGPENRTAANRRPDADYENVDSRVAKPIRGDHGILSGFQ